MTEARRSDTIKLTKDQQDAIRRMTGRQAEELELTVEELEERVVPFSHGVTQPVS